LKRSRKFIEGEGSAFKNLLTFIEKKLLREQNSYFYYDMDDKEISVSQITNVYKDDRIPVFKRVTSTRRSTLPEMTMIEDNPFSALEGRSLP
jgi:hypothetical protein